MSYDIKKLSILYDRANINELNQFLCELLSCSVSVISWYVSGFWYIAAIYDNLIDDKTHDNNGSGWYLYDKPDINNIPIRHAKVQSCVIFDTENTRIICGFCTISSSPTSNLTNKTITINASPTINVSPIVPEEYSFFIKTYMEKLYLLDLVGRQKKCREISLNNITDSIRKPLNNLITETNNILNNSQNPLQEKLQSINKNTIELASNIFDSVDIIKLELGQIDLEYSVFKLADAVAESIAVLSYAGNIQLFIEESVPKIINSDRRRIKQVLINLLSNAIKHGRNKDIVLYVSSTVVNIGEEDKNNDVLYENTDKNKIESLQHVVYFLIKDEGTGIDAEIKSQLFYPPDFVKKYKYTGTSMRISYMISKLLGGNLRVVYSGEQGTCMEFSIIVPNNDSTSDIGTI